MIARSGGVIVTVRGRRARTVPVLDRYHAPLLAAAAFAGTGLICGGADPGRRNITSALVAALGGGGGLPRLDASRFRATWLRDCAEHLGLATFMHAAGISCSQWLGDLVAGLGASRVGRSGAATRRRAAMIPLAALEEIIGICGVAPRTGAMLPAGVRPRQLTVHTLLAGMCLTQASWPTPSRSNCADCAMSARPASGSSRSTAPATTITTNRSSSLFCP